MRVALVHDWLTGMRGGEKCLEVLCRLLPEAHLFTLLCQRDRLSPPIARMDIRTSFLQRVPGVLRHYRYFLPLMPVAIESFRLDGYDLVVSLSHCVAKAVRVPARVPHLCYCFTPMRYAWHMREAYFESPDGHRCDSIGAALRAAGRALASVPRDALLADLRRWDRATSHRVTHFVAISRTVQTRIQECYGRDSLVIYPPANVAFYTPATVSREDFYLCVSAFAPYKRIDLAIESCNRLRRRLVVVGTGQDEARLRRLAGPTVEFLGWQSDGAIRELYRRCRALLFPGVEDFGIVPVEAQACGTPVIAVARGGTSETIAPPEQGLSPTGLLFEDQTAAGLMAAIEQFERAPGRFLPSACRARALLFAQQRFEDAIQSHIEDVAGVTLPVTTERRRLAA
jgi:glycosyltransferase involved in cell wall biosynthesis